MTVSKTALLAEVVERNKIQSSKNTAELNPNFPKQNAFIEDPSRYIAAQCSRRAGKCRAVGTLIKTPTGAIPIENIKVGDIVYGYNTVGYVSECAVKEVFNQGEQEVVDLLWNGRVLATSTMNHRWLAHNTFNNSRTVKELKDFNSRDKIALEYFPISGGSKIVKEAYALGALLGDGSGMSAGLLISGKDSAVFDKMANSLSCYWTKSHPNNHNHYMRGIKKLEIPFYAEWCHNKLAHEKTCDINELRSWTRKSQLEFIAGLMDTDGSIVVSSDGRLTIRLNMQAEVVISAVQNLILDLFQVQAQRQVDSRSKYKNGPVHELRVSANIESKRILKELPMQCPRKQWKPEYEDLVERNLKSNYVGFEIGNKRKAQCYDIEVDNDTHLFLDANGLVGHNTNGLAYRFDKTMLKYPKSQCVYLGLTRDSAKGAMWPAFQELNDRYRLGYDFIESKLTIVHPNGAKLMILGADMPNFIKRLKGRKFPGVAIDEAQDYGTHIESLIDDVLTPSISDYTDGWLAITGTPGPVPQGYFFDVTRNKKHGFSHHEWTLYENPNMPEPQAFVDDLKKRKEWADNNPTLLREWLNHWVLDVQALWIRYSSDKNHYQELPKDHKWQYVIGVDIGFKDADALAVIAWAETSRVTYLVEEIIKNKQGISELIEQIDGLQKKYNAYKIVMDEGGLGKKIGEEIRRRFLCPLMPADKANKQDNVEFLNDDMRLGRFMAKSASRFAQDSYMVQIDWDKSTPKRIILKNTFHSDIIDAVLYAYRESYSFTHQAEKEAPKWGTKEWAEAQSSLMFEKELEGHQQENSYDGQTPYNDWLIGKK